jgi:hypothetical protein
MSRDLLERQAKTQLAAEQQMAEAERADAHALRQVTILGTALFYLSSISHGKRMHRT